MSNYVINRTDGSYVVNIYPGTLDTTATSLRIPGRAYVAYGEVMAENLVHVMENFANQTPPNLPMEGQLWFHNWEHNAAQPDNAITNPPTENRLNVYVNSGWVPLAHLKVGPYTGRSTVHVDSHGQLFYNPTSGQLFTADTNGATVPGDARLLLIGPVSPRGTDTQVRRLLVTGTAAGTATTVEGLGSIAQGRLLSIYYGGTTALDEVTAITDGSDTDIVYAAADFQFTGQSDLLPGLTFSKNAGGYGRLYTANHHPLEHDAHVLGTALRRWQRLTVRDLSVANVIVTDSSGTEHTITFDQYIRRDSGEGAAASRVPSATGLEFGSAASPWGTFYVQTIKANTLDTGGTAGTLKGSGGWTVQDADLKIDGHNVVPATNDTGSLGTPSRLWNACHINYGSFFGVGVTDISPIYTPDRTVATALNLNADAVAGGFLYGPWTVANHDLTFANSRNVIPATDNTGSLGTETNSWASAHISTVNSSSLNASSLTAVPGTQLNLVAAAGNQGAFFGQWVLASGATLNATYADVAERYAAPVGETLEPGDVVRLGGDAEITKTTESHDLDVFGVVSTAPAFVLNDAAEGYPVALAGRVPVKVIGRVKKGQRLVSSDRPGVAMAVVGQPSLYAVIGRALADKTSDGLGLVEITVGKN